MFNFSQKIELFPEKIICALHNEVGASLSTVFLDLSTNICNFDCYFCDSKFLPKQPQQFSTERLMQIADELHQLNVDSVLLCGDGGEPFMHTGIVPLVRKLYNYGIHIGVYTNGSILREDIKEILPMFDFIRVSLNASDEQTHKLIHRYKQADYWKAIKEFVSSALTCNVNIGASFLILKENYKEMYAVSRLSKQIGMNYIEFKPAYIVDYKLDSFMYEESVRQAIIEGYHESISLQSDDFRVVPNNQLTDYLKGMTDITSSISQCRCVTSRLRLVISPSGCYLCTPYRGHTEYSIGNPQLSSIQEIWYGVRHRELWNLECRYKCPYYEQNQVLLKFQKGESSFAQHRNLISKNATTQKSFL